MHISLPLQPSSSSWEKHIQVIAIWFKDHISQTFSEKQMICNSKKTSTVWMNGFYLRCVLLNGTVTHLQAADSSSGRETAAPELGGVLTRFNHPAITL